LKLKTLIILISGNLACSVMRPGETDDLNEKKTAIHSGATMHHVIQEQQNAS
jgi:hypothetical protein